MTITLEELDHDKGLSPRPIVTTYAEMLRIELETAEQELASCPAYDRERWRLIVERLTARIAVETPTEISQAAE